MRMTFTKIIAATVLPAVLLGMSSCAMNYGNDNTGDIRRVDGVMWNKKVETDINNILAKEVPANKSRLVFIRNNDNYPEQTSANIAINNRFQVSLHSGNFTAVESCVGTNQLSVHATGFKSNNLLKDKQTYELTGGKTYFFNVDMDEKGQGAIHQLTSKNALSLLENKSYQSHQISRVVQDCPLPIKPTPLTTVSPVTSNTQTSVLAEKVIIDLEVLFETDKAIVRPEYYSKITELAEFMKEYPNTIVTVEGHTDSRGKDDYNQALSQRRVNALKEVLITQFGMASERINAVGYGESQPRASNDTAEGRQLNRRVVAVVEERLRN